MPSPGSRPLAVSLRCDGCGAPLFVAEKVSALTCSYCGRALIVVAGTARVEAGSEARATADRFLRGYTGEDVGTGDRYTKQERPTWADAATTLWPTSASASSEFGLGWGASALIGPPRVFPDHGDRSGAWAPRSKESSVEWIEVGFPTSGPASHIVRIFETNVPGSVFAVTLVHGSSAERSEELVWQRRPGPVGAPARILEVKLPRAAPVERVRVYAKNDLGSTWSEIDTVGLVTVAPVPVELQRRPERSWAGWGCALGLMAALAGGMTVAWTQSCATDLATSSDLERPSDALAGTLLLQWSVDRAGLSRVIWASELGPFSSEYSADRNAALQALGPPDVFPAHVDGAGAWASRGRDDGLEHIEVRFVPPVRASAVVVVETFNPGALARIEARSEGAPPVLLWEGTSRPAGVARVLSLELPSPRTIGAVRLVLDTSRIAGWNALDAIGLVPAP